APTIRAQAIRTFEHGSLNAGTTRQKCSDVWIGGHDHGQAQSRLDANHRAARGTTSVQCSVCAPPGDLWASPLRCSRLNSGGVFGFADAPLCKGTTLANNGVAPLGPPRPAPPPPRKTKTCPKTRRPPRVRPPPPHPRRTITTAPKSCGGGSVTERACTAAWQH